MPKPRLILQLEVKAGGVAERAARRGRGDEYKGIDVEGNSSGGSCIIFYGICETAGKTV